MPASTCRNFANTFVALTTLVLCGMPARADRLDAIYREAQAEGGIIIYVGGPTAPWDSAAQDFSARYPGVTVSITGGFSNVLDRKIDAQLKDGKLEVDLAVFQTLQDFVRWKQEGRLLNFKPEGFDKIDRSFKDENGTFISVQINADPYAYNPDLVKLAEVPRSALDFLEPRFKGKVVSAYPADDDATLYVFYSIVRKYGWSYMDQYMANQPNFIQGHLGVARSIAAGENLVTFDSVAGSGMRVKSEGQPQAIAFSQSDNLPIWPLTAAIFKSAPHPNAARLFLTWYLSPEEQVKIGTWSPRSDVRQPFGWKPILSYKVFNNYRKFLTRTRQLAELRKRFEAYTDPVKNTGGVQ